jgi:hypothetical protein
MGLTAMRNRETMPGMTDRPEQFSLEDEYQAALDEELRAMLTAGTHTDPARPDSDGDDGEA